MAKVACKARHRLQGCSETSPCTHRTNSHVISAIILLILSSEEPMLELTDCTKHAKAGGMVNLCSFG